MSEAQEWWGPWHSGCRDIAPEKLVAAYGPGRRVSGPAYWRHALEWCSGLDEKTAARQDSLRVKLRLHGEFDGAVVGLLPDGRYLVLLPVDADLRALERAEVELSAKRSTPEGRKSRCFVSRAVPSPQHAHFAVAACLLIHCASRLQLK